MPSLPPEAHRPDPWGVQAKLMGKRKIGWMREMCDPGCVDFSVLPHSVCLPPLSKLMLKKVRGFLRGFCVDFSVRGPFPSSIWRFTLRPNPPPAEKFTHPKRAKFTHLKRAKFMHPSPPRFGGKIHAPHPSPERTKIHAPFPAPSPPETDNLTSPIAPWTVL